MKTSAVLLSITEIAAEFQVDRETARRRLREARLQPAGKRRGYSVYRARDVIPVIWGVCPMCCRRGLGAEQLASVMQYWRRR